MHLFFFFLNLWLLSGFVLFLAIHFSMEQILHKTSLQNGQRIRGSSVCEVFSSPFVFALDNVGSCLFSSSVVCRFPRGPWREFKGSLVFGWTKITFLAYQLKFNVPFQYECGQQSTVVLAVSVALSLMESQVCSYPITTVICITVSGFQSCLSLLWNNCTY